MVHRPNGHRRIDTVRASGFAGAETGNAHGSERGGGALRPPGEVRWRPHSWVGIVCVSIEFQQTRLVLLVVASLFPVRLAPVDVLGSRMSVVFETAAKYGSLRAMTCGLDV